MNKMVKRLTTVLLVATLVIGSAISASAAGSPVNPNTPKKQTNVTAENGSKVNTNVAGEANLKSVKKTSAKSVTVGEVKTGDVTYKVTTISKKAFKNASKATTVNIKGNEMTVKKGAFEDSKVKTVKFDVAKGAKAEDFVFAGGSFKNSKVTSIVVSKNMSKSEYKKLVEALRDAGYTGKVSRK